MRYRKFLPALALLALSFASLTPARAAGGEIGGAVTDPQGGIVAGAQVTATDAATQKSSTATTDAQGRYKIAGLAAGTYVVAVTAQGFAETKQEDVRVEDGKTATANVRMLLPAD
jgi:hypothetical protein